MLALPLVLPLVLVATLAVREASRPEPPRPSYPLKDEEPGPPVFEYLLAFTITGSFAAPGLLHLLDVRRKGCWDAAGCGLMLSAIPAGGLMLAVLLTEPAGLSLMVPLYAGYLALAVMTSRRRARDDELS